MTIRSPIEQVLASNPNLGTVDEKLQTGLSDSYVYVLRTSLSGKSVLKIQIDQAEYDFYLRFAPEKLGDVRWLPRVLAGGHYGDWNWIQLEYIPNPWPRPMWNVDERALRILRTLHETPVSIDDFEWINCSWQPADLDFCKDVLPPHTIDLLFRFQEAFSDVVGRDAVLCSGDPYPLNWLERPGGELVKVDWQVLALENRAFDLAGWISTPIPLSDIERIARLYFGLGSGISVYEDVASLTRSIVFFYARRCASIFKQAAQSSQPERWRSGVHSMQEQLPSWLLAVAHVLE